MAVQLLSNPLIATYRRLAHRSGVWPLILLVLVAGGTVIYLAYYLRAMRGPQGSDIGFYIAVLVAQGLFLIIPWMGKVSQALVTERREGLLETNWLTPLRPWELAAGYLLGPPACEFYAYLLSLPIALAVAWIVQLPMWFWGATQALVLSTGLVAGLLGLVGGAVFRTSAGGGSALVLLLVWGMAAGAGAMALTNFIIPIHLMVDLFARVTGERPIEASPGGAMATVFGTPRLFVFVVPSAALTAVAQAAACVWLWTAARRKFADPDQRALTGWMVVALFGMLVIAQHGLLWHDTQGRFPAVPRDVGLFLALVHVVTVLLGLVFVATHLLNGQQVRTELLGRHYRGLAPVLARSGVWLALRLGLVGSAALFTQCYASASAAPWHFLIPALNLLLALTILALVLEVSALWFGPAFFRVGVLAVFVLYFLPLLFFSLGWREPDLWAYSLLVPGAYALAAPASGDLQPVKLGTFGHLLIAAALASLWVGAVLGLIRQAASEEQPAGAASEATSRS